MYRKMLYTVEEGVKQNSTTPNTVKQNHMSMWNDPYIHPNP